MSMILCKTCIMPNTRPDVPFIDGECAACRNHKNRININWDDRKDSLIKLLDRFDGKVIVPSSGGKDSSYIVLTLLDLGADVTIVTARTCHLTTVGRANIDNLSRYARTIEVVPNMTVRAKLNRLGLEMVGDISWPEHAAIFSTPFRVAKQLGINLIMYGECPQTEYGGPMGSEKAMQMTRRWVTEFGGFLGLRPSDFVGIEGITARDMEDYTLPIGLENTNIEAHFLGQYIPWDSHRNAQVAKEAGMISIGRPPSNANWWEWENLDNAQTGIHDYFMYKKYGFGRASVQLSVDVRNGKVTREFAERMAKPMDTIFPTFYADVHVGDMLDNIGMSIDKLNQLAKNFEGLR